MPPTNIPVIIRPALKRACCENDACRAAIYSQLLYSIARKVKAGCDYWYGTYQEIWEILDKSWGLSKVIKEINALVDQGFLKQRRNPVKGYDQTRQYLFGMEEATKFREACEKAGVCVHEMGFGAEVTHLLKITNGFIECNKCICSNQQLDLLNPTDAFVENNRAIPESTTEDTTQNTFTESTDRETQPAGTEEPTRAPNQSIDLSPEEKAVYDLCVKAKAKISRKSVKEHCTKLVEAGVKTEQDVKELYALAQEELKKDCYKDKRVWIGNLVKMIEDWQENREAQAKKPTEEKEDEVLWSRCVQDQGFRPGVRNWFSYEWMPLSVAQKFHYGKSGFGHYMLKPEEHQKIAAWLEIYYNGGQLPEEAKRYMEEPVTA